jgi:GNAT superfamily N-acetyltransferase
MQIKPCSEEHLEELVAISKTAYLDHYTYLWNDEGAKYVALNFNTEQLREELCHPNSLFYLLYVESNLVGFLKLNVDSGLKSHSATTALELERIYFTKAVTGKGLGKTIIDFVIDLANKKSKTIVWLKAMDSSRSVNFYQKHHFKIVDEMTLNFEHMKDEYRKLLTLYRII